MLSQSLQFVVTALVLLVPPLAAAQQRHYRETPEETIWTGRYGNCDHGFFVLLPRGVLGHGDKAPSPSHGFMVNMAFPGSDRPAGQFHHRVLWVNEDYVLERGKDPYTLILRTGRDPDQPSKARSTASPPQRTHLGGLPAVLVRTSYLEDGRKYVWEEVASLSRDKAIQYTITLDTTAADAAIDQVLFRSIAAGFHSSPIDNSGSECSND